VDMQRSMDFLVKQLASMEDDGSWFELVLIPNTIIKIVLSLIELRLGPSTGRASGSGCKRWRWPYPHHTSVAVFQGKPPGYFTHISITTPIVSALKNYYR
jgi:hypothetical protein